MTMIVALTYIRYHLLGTDFQKRPFNFLAVILITLNFVLF
jgi:hypothetical protein